MALASAREKTNVAAMTAYYATDWTIAADGISLGPRKWRDWNSPTGEDAMRFDVAGIALAFSLIAVPALAEDTIKIGYIDPLSGGGASIGEGGLKTYQYLADEINAAGGLNGKKVEIVGARQQDQSAGKPDSGAEGRRPGHPHHHPGQRLFGRPRPCPTG